MKRKFLNYIDGKWVNATSGRTIVSINPADSGDTIGTVPSSSDEDVDSAARAAKSAFQSWRRIPPPRRGEILFRVAELLQKNKLELGKLVCREMGKVLPEALGDVQEAIDMAYYMAGEGRRLSGETVPSELPNKDAKSIRVPIGVFGLITPWNFPVAIPSWKIFPALISGNTVIFKPSSDTPVCATRFVEIILESDLPQGVLNLVHGEGNVVGSAIVKHPDIQAVSFTGSSETGSILEGICGILHKPISTETGGKNPIIVMEDANLDLAVDGALWGGFGTTGQRCTAASRVIVHEAVHDRFIQKFKKKASKLRIGNGMKKATQIGPIINRSQYQKILNYIEIGKNEGAKLILGGKARTSGECSKGHFIEPTIFINVSPTMRIANEEIFGPVVSILKIRSLDEAIQIANQVAYGLSSAIYTGNVNNSAIAERELDTGIVYINASTIGAEIQLPFGGTKKTGYGPREAGGRGGALDHYSKWKVIYRDYSGRLQKAQIDKS
ncbi:MAG: aldehyde dehydrogenase family protein [Nitrospirae bacterium]|nr:aldehyde dehydrogenase family protein [Nitrospirota bacterium]